MLLTTNNKYTWACCVKQFKIPSQFVLPTIQYYYYFMTYIKYLIFDTKFFYQKHQSNDSPLGLVIGKVSPSASELVVLPTETLVTILHLDLQLCMYVCMYVHISD